MKNTITISKKQLKEIIQTSIKEQLNLAGEEEAEQAIIDWFEIANPHGATKPVFIKYLDGLIKKYGRGGTMTAFNNLYTNKKWLKFIKTPRGKEIFVFKKQK